MDINKLKAANDIFELMVDKTVDEAMKKLNTYENLDKEVLRLVTSLINNNQQPSEIFNQKVTNQFKPMPAKTWLIGDEIGEYKLLENIGQGGMSTVFKAQRIESDSQKPVAIKIFSMSVYNHELKSRFMAEQNILAELSHPHIIRFHHGENTDQGDSYIVMELLENGLALDDFVKTKHLGTKQIIELITHVADALQYAHTQFIIHRDIKPSNLMVDSNNQVKVLDFGIAKLINLDLEKDQNQTIMALTPNFASPEQINAKKIGITSDVFSLAAVVVYLISDQQPFPANRLLKSCVDDESHVKTLLKKYIQDQDLRNILNHALQQDPKHRYPNMFAFKEDLSAWLKQRPVSASKDSWWYRMNRFAARRTALFVTSLVLCSTVVVAIIALSMQNQAIKLEAEKANAVKQFMLDSFSVTDPNVSQGVDLSTKDLLRLAGDKMTANDGMDAVIKFELYVALALANGQLGYYPEAITLLNNALLVQPKDEQATALLAQYLFFAGEIKSANALLIQTKENDFSSIAEKAAVKRVRAKLLAQSGDYNQAFAQFDSLEVLESTDMDTLKNQSLLAEIYFLKGESEHSIKILQELKKNHPLPATDVFSLSLNSDLVQYYDSIRNYEAAMVLTLENIKTFREILGDEHPNLGLAYNSLSAFQWLGGQLDEALISAEISKKIYRKRYGESSEGLSQAHSNAGMVYYYKQQYEPAINELTLAANMLEGIFGDDHLETMNAKRNLAIILNALEYQEKALPILQHIYKVELDTLGKNHRSALYTQQSLALTLGNLGQYEQAIVYAQENMRLITENYPDQADFINHANSVLGRIYFMAGKHELAIKQNLFHISQWTQGNENNYARSLFLVAESYQELHLYDKANEYYQKWTKHLLKIYGKTDVKYLQGLLEWADKSQRMDQKDQAEALMLQVQSLLIENDLKLDKIQTKLKELSLK